MKSAKRSPLTLLNELESFDKTLPTYCREHLEQVSTAFLATKHTTSAKDPDGDQSDMGFNHRGGRPGFIRVFEEIASDNPQKINTYIVLPDFSGNRFYQSLGNIQGDPQVGLVFPDFKTGNVLYITGVAENLFLIATPKS